MKKNKIILYFLPLSVCLFISTWLLAKNNVIIVGPKPRNFQKVNIGIGFQTKPKVNKNGEISTDININKNEFGGKTNYKASYSPFKAQVKWVYDGDSIKVQSGKRVLMVRLYGIDAPESKQPFGKKSLQNLMKLVKDKQVYIKPITLDKYKRYVSKVYFIEEKNNIKEKKYINLEQVKNGYAWHYKRYAPNDTDLAQAQEQACKDKLGLWVQKNPIYPETYRYSKKKKSEVKEKKQDNNTKKVKPEEKKEQKKELKPTS
ncbi:thermonuclease family protein [Lentisphaerota bacterium WC36G]|nr:thermonuclease family protein [Lentisphaerae bacterium WC36]